MIGPLPSSSGKKKGGDKPPYARYAFLNPYNLTLLAGATATAAATGHWWIAVCAAASEGLWMLFAPDSKVLRSAWFDKMWLAQKQAELEEQQDQKLAKMWPNDVIRFRTLREQQARIFKLAVENPSLTTELISSELEKVGALLDDFLDLAVLCARSEQHLQTFDFKELQRTYEQYTAQLAAYPPGDRRRSVAQKNVDVLKKRRSRFDELQRLVQTSRGQMDLMENTFRLLADEILTMATPTELGTRLDELRIGVEAVRETTTGSDDLYEELQELEEEEAAAAKPGRRAR